jgi:hypothetical protein
MENIEENNEMIWKIQMKSKLKWFRKYGRKCEMIWKIWKKSKLKWYGKYGRKVSWNDMENMEEK